jgi:phosphoribosylglycinamide formyltransferase-1
VLVSGSGTNLQAILDHCAKGKIDAEVAVVISNRPEAFALTRARRAGVPAVAVPPKEHADREAYDAKLVEVLRAHRVNLVCLAGFMRLLSPGFIRAFPGRILNIHPALLPSFPGLDVQQKAIEHGVRFSGCTVHVVDEGCDTGPIVIQAVVPVAPGDTAATLAARILAQEHRIYPRAIQLFAEGRVGAPQGRRLRVRGAAWTDRALVNPPLADGAAPRRARAARKSARKRKR